MTLFFFFFFCSDNGVTGPDAIVKLCDDLDELLPIGRWGLTTLVVVIVFTVCSGTGRVGGDREYPWWSGGPRCVEGERLRRLDYVECFLVDKKN